MKRLTDEGSIPETRWKPCLNQTNKKVKKDQIKSRSEYKIMGFTLESMLSHAYALGRINQLYHPEDVSDSLKKEAIYQASKIGNWDVFEIIEK